MDRLTQFRIWWWKVRYAFQLRKRGRSEDGGRFSWSAYMEMAREGWVWCMDCEKVVGDSEATIRATLKLSPKEEANEEMSNWDPVL